MDRLAPKELERITANILDRMRTGILSASDIPLRDYHGFRKGRIPLAFLHASYSDTLLQAELVEVTTDLSHEVHRHLDAHAHCYVLGEQEGYTNPHGALAFLENAWFAVRQGDVVTIPPNTLHGFTVKPGGTLQFLSVQSPAIERDGHDDYHREDVPKPQF